MQSLIQTNLQFLREQRRYKSVKDGNLMVARVGPSKNKSMYICIYILAEPPLAFRLRWHSSSLYAFIGGRTICSRILCSLWLGTYTSFKGI